MKTLVLSLEDLTHMSELSVGTSIIPIFLVILFCLGLIIGSFLNVVIFRLPNQLYTRWRSEAEAVLGTKKSTESNHTDTLVFPNSKCRDCSHPIKLRHKIPVISYLMLRGNCRYCSSKISLQYPIIEVITGIIFTLTIIQFGFSVGGLLAIIFSTGLIALAGIDFREKLLPDQITLPLMWIGLLANTQGIYVPIIESVIGASAGYLVLWSIFWMFKLITGKDGMGYGDFKLTAALGAWLGWKMLPLIVLLSSGLGALVGIFAIILRLKSRDSQLPFGPFLAFSGWLVIIWGDTILLWYTSLFNSF